MVKKSKPLSCDEQLISLREIADLWSCSRSTVARLLDKAGIIPYDFTGSRNGTKRYRKSEVSEFMDDCLSKRQKPKQGFAAIVESSMR